MQTTTRQTLVALFERMGFLSDGVSFEEARAAFNRYVETKYQFNGLVVEISQKHGETT